MKKLIACLLLAALILTCFAACGKKDFTCDICGRTVREKPHKTEILGEEAVLCERCYKEIKEMRDGFNDLAGTFG